MNEADKQFLDGLQYILMGIMVLCSITLPLLVVQAIRAHKEWKQALKDLEEDDG